MSGGFFALLDDISVLMDSTSTAAKTAAKNTAGVLGDDLAVSAAKASDFSASRELPVLWAITKGSFLNKIIIIPIMLALSYYFPAVITPVLLLGGLYLSYEGAHGVWGFIFPHEKEHPSEQKEENSQEESEKSKIKDAIITDFVLSIEIVLIALASVQKEPFATKVIVVTFVSFLATIGVYGLVAFLVRFDDMGFALAKNAKTGSFKRKFGLKMAAVLPIIVKILSVVGIFAMLMVAGGIFLHNIHILHEIMHPIPTLAAELILPLLIGGAAMIIIDGGRALFKKIQ